jgi:hypothetical protein
LRQRLLQAFNASCVFLFSSPKGGPVSVPTQEDLTAIVALVFTPNSLV